MKGTQIKLGKLGLQYAVGNTPGYRERVKVLAEGQIPGTWCVEFDDRSTAVLGSRAIKARWEDEEAIRQQRATETDALFARIAAEETKKTAALEEILPAFAGITVTGNQIGEGRAEDELDLADVLCERYIKKKQRTTLVRQEVFVQIGERIKQLSLEKQGAFWS